MQQKSEGNSSRVTSMNPWMAAIILLAAIFRLGWFVYTPYTEEDAFITFRFARQLADGNGFVYNIGEKIYGTTTPLFIQTIMYSTATMHSVCKV